MLRRGNFHEHDFPLSGAIEVQALTKRYPAPRDWAGLIPSPRHWTSALDQVSLQVGPGQVFGILGPNGAGKTTLLKILSTLVLPTAGRAWVSGLDVAEAPLLARRSVGYCLDTERSFYYRLTGIQNLEFFAALNDVPRHEVASRVADLLRLVGLAPAGAARFMTYSSGMRQRLGLARALLADPDILLLDEPTKSLDPHAARDFRRFVRDELAGRLGKTVLLVTHTLEEARDCCDRLAVMESGRIVLEGRWEDAEAFFASRPLSVDASGTAP